MSQSGKTQRNKGRTEPSANSRPKSPERRGRGTAIMLISAVIVLILIIAGVFAYPTYIAPFRKPVITVNDVTIRMDYFLKRIKMSGADPLSMLSQLTNEQMIKLGAPQYGIKVGDEEIDQSLRAMFQGSSANVSADPGIYDAEFKEWYRQRLNETELSDVEYREIVATSLLRSYLQEYLALRMPNIAEQIHLYAITLDTLKAAEKARERWAAGEGFGDLAKELSLDMASAEKGGEIGWFPEGGILTPQIEYEAFALTTGNASEPIPIMQEQALPEGGSAPAVVGYYLLLVTERADRQLDDNALQMLRSQVVDVWLAEERKNYTIRWRGINNENFDSETYAWINYQLAKSKSASSSK